MKRPLSGEVQGHLVIGLMALAVVVASVVLTPSDSVVSFFGWDVPPLCMFKRITGMDCPGCGLTRSFTYMGHGDVIDAFTRHKLGPPFYLFVAAQVPWRAVKLWRLWRGGAV